MERVTFLVQGNGERLSCLLNPEEVVMKRLAGIRPRRLDSGPLTGASLTDDPLIYTGGGSTEMQLDLLFDVNLSGSSLNADDVRQLTGPLVALAENRQPDRRPDYAAPSVVRFIWGKSWNLLGVISAVAERFESFSASGAPSRSWLRMRFLRVAEPISAPASQGATAVGGTAPRRMHGGASPETDNVSRMDQMCDSPGDWKSVAERNDIDNPFAIPTGMLLRFTEGE